eukprot:Skav233647  [mRNA]  locus=scaffold2779:724481:727663:- [translate_table: standard]
MLPDPCLQELLDIVMQWGHHPQWDMLARTVPLAKHTGRLKASDSRPITILSSLYRVWARVSCFSLVRHMMNSLPPQVAGLLPGRGALQAIYKQQWSLELAKRLRQSLQGVTLDLRKCFNLLNRQRLYQLFRQLGLPLQLIDCWYRSLTSLRRFWSLGDFSSRPVSSTTGCPEGDSWSVLAIICVCTLWTSYVQQRAEGASCSAYADNWTWWGDTTVHSPTADCTQEVCRFFGLEIDWAKTWIWSTDGVGIPALQRLIQDLSGLDHAQIRTTAVDLGCQVSYQKHAVFGAMKTRFAEAKTRLQRLQNQSWDFGVKLHMVKASIFPSAFYGAELVLVPPYQLESLRTQVVYAILGHTCKSVSSAILHDLLPGVRDPQVHVILLALRSAQQFLHTATAADRQQFLHILSRHCPTFHAHGPASVLREYMHRVGLSFNNAGTILGGEHEGCNLLTSSVVDVAALVLREWQRHLLVLQTTRKHVGQYLPVDRVATIGLLRRFTGKQQVVLLRELAGGFQPRTQQAVWDDDVSEMCPWCGQCADTRPHRLFECSVFADIRRPYGALLQDIEEHSLHLCYLPALRESGEGTLVKLLHTAMPLPEMTQDMQHSITRLSQLTTPVFFTDGSCAFPASASLRFASFSVILDVSTSDSERCEQVRRFRTTGASPTTFLPFVTARLPGRQSINRAELMAVVWLCQHVDQAIIYSDSSYVCNWVWKLQRFGASLLSPVLADFDLLSQLAIFLTTGIVLRKIKAHRDCAAIQDDQECYLALGNEAADKLAVFTNKTMFPELAQQLWDYADTFKQQEQQMRDFYRYLLDLNAARTRTMPLDADDVETGSEPQHLLTQLAAWQATGPWTYPAEVNQAGLASSDWGLQLMHTIHQWLQSCSWPSTPEECPGPKALGFAWLELAVALIHIHGMFLPVRRTMSDGETYLVQPCTSVEAVQLGITMTEQATVATQALQQYQALIPESTSPQFDKGKVRSMAVFGLATRLSGMKLRPSFPGQNKMLDVLTSFLPDMDGLPSFEFTSGFQTWAEDVDTFRTPNEILQTRLRKAKKIAKQLRSR